MTREEMIRSLKDIRKYLTGCANNAMKFSDAWAKFVGWNAAIDNAIDTINEKPEKAPEIRCGYCGNTISDRFKWCPYCGRGVPYK